MRSGCRSRNWARAAFHGYELHNLAGMVSFGHVLRRMKERLVTRMRATVHRWQQARGVGGGARVSRSQRSTPQRPPRQALSTHDGGRPRRAGQVRHRPHVSRIGRPITWPAPPLGQTFRFRAPAWGGPGERRQPPRHRSSAG